MAKSKPRKPKKQSAYKVGIAKLDKIINDPSVPIDQKVLLASTLGFDIADIGASPSDLKAPKEPYE